MIRGRYSLGMVALLSSENVEPLHLIIERLSLYRTFVSSSLSVISEILEIERTKYLPLTLV